MYKVGIKKTIQIYVLTSLVFFFFVLFLTFLTAWNDPQKSTLYHSYSIRCLLDVEGFKTSMAN